MKRAAIITYLLLASVSSNLLANEKVKLSGFGSIVGGVVIDGDGYWARLPDGAGQYTHGIELQSESRLGVQARYAANDSLNIIGQVMLRGVNDFEPQLEWFYANYSVTPDINFKVGKMRLPVYHFSDYMDVGVAYPWVRVPSDAYSLAVTNYQGLSLDMNLDFGDVTSTIRLYAGQQDTDPNKLITLLDKYKGEQLYDQNGTFSGLREIRTTKKYEQMKGIVVDTNYESITLRLSYLDGKENFTSYAEGQYPSNPLFGGEWVDTQFIDVSLQYDADRILALAEWNDYDNIYTSWFTSFAYRLDKWTPYIYYSEFQGTFRFIAPGGISNGYEDGVTGTLDDYYTSVGVGARYDLSPATAIKFELLKFNDKGDAAVFVDQNQDGKTDSSAFFMSLDFTF
ncbi:hypothetical protein [Psychrosphaera aestuarii]|uniref:hypothetical protein n=1 Tax=Psychrosphaera aestuarii TaxID=1266052 RepID=UPI001B31CACE|nr:hypothetical protein [Psychrosphaera aestuarii]